MALFSPEFMDDLAGALLAGVADGGLEALQKAIPTLTGKFPFITYDNLPQTDKLIILGVSAAPYIYAKVKKTNFGTAYKFGKGMTGYSLPMILDKIVVKAMGGA